MKQFKVFKHPSGTSKAVKQGWSWPAFFFSPFWAMVKTMWGLGVGVLIGNFLFGLIIDAAGGGTGFYALEYIVVIIVSVIFGVSGNLWYENNLISRGFEQVGKVTAATPEGAVALYLKGVNAEH